LKTIAVCKELNRVSHKLNFHAVYRKECKKLKEELDAQSVCALFSNETLFRTQQKLQKKEVELMQAQVQIIELQELMKQRKGRT
jgi:hypothetical protein